MGKPATLEGFSLRTLLDQLMPPAGFVMTMRLWDRTILLTIEDHRAHADFAGDCSPDRLPELLERVTEAGLDVRKAIVSLSSRKEPPQANKPESYNVGVVQVGWKVSVPAHLTSAPPRPSAKAHVVSCRLSRGPVRS